MKVEAKATSGTSVLCDFSNSWTDRAVGVCFQ